MMNAEKRQYLRTLSCFWGTNLHSSAALNNGTYNSKKGPMCNKCEKPCGQRFIKISGKPYHATCMHDKIPESVITFFLFNMLSSIYGPPGLALSTSSTHGHELGSVTANLGTKCKMNFDGSWSVVLWNYRCARCGEPATGQIIRVYNQLEIDHTASEDEKTHTKAPQSVLFFQVK